MTIKGSEMQEALGEMPLSTLVGASMLIYV
jgi:hypothetical protein